MILGETTVNAELVMKAGLLLGAGGEVLVDLKRWNPCMATNTLFIFIAFIVKKHLRLIDEDPSDISNKST